MKKGPREAVLMRIAPTTRQCVLACVILVVVSLLVYIRALSNGFVDYDDHAYLTQNSQVQAGLTRATIRWAFTTYTAGNWHPLTWISHALDVQMFGMSPAGHHFMSIVLHSLNAVFVFLLLFRATGALRRSLVVALLFAVHPLNVECVAWAAERKSLLSTFFFLLALAAYGWYARRPSIQRYGLVALLFALGLMAKPMVITLPCVLVLLDFWPLRRVDLRTQSGNARTVPQQSLLFVLLEKAPLLVLVAASAFTTMIAQSRGRAVMPLWAVPVSWRLANAIRAYSLYLVKAFWPVNLGVFYPITGFQTWQITSLQLWQVLASLLFLTAVSVWAWRERRSHPYMMFGWLWYLGTLVPVIGLVQVGSQSMADRYAYIPLIGIFVMVVWRLADVADSFSLPQLWRIIPACLVLLVLAALTRNQLGFWQNDLKLWTHTAAVTPVNALTEDNLGIALMNLQRLDEATVHFNNAIRIHPNEPTAYIALGYVLRNRDPQLAIKDGLTALALREDPRALPSEPIDAIAIYGNLGVAYGNLGDYAHAADSFQKVLKQDPGDATALIGLGYALLEERAQKLGQNLEKRPSAEGFSELGSIYEQATDMQNAKLAYQKALSIDPRLTSAQQGMERLGNLAQSGHPASTQ